jgi:hypothetical protein
VGAEAGFTGGLSSLLCSFYVIEYYNSQKLLACLNTRLLIDIFPGCGFVLHQRMKHLAGNKALQHDFRAAKQANKAKLAALIKSRCGVEVRKRFPTFSPLRKVRNMIYCSCSLSNICS